MKPTTSPMMQWRDVWSISEAATYMQDLLIGQAMWRYRIGRDFEDVLHDINGLSLTWRDESRNETLKWFFTFSLRRNGQWHKATTAIDVRPLLDEDGEQIEEVDASTEVITRVDFAIQHLMTEIARHAFPEVVAEEEERRRKENVNLDD